MKPSQQNILSQSLVPNSVAYKKTNLELAQEALLIAKSIPRIVRRAKPNECEFSREIERNKTAGPKKTETREDGLINAKEAVEIFGISEFTIHLNRKKGLLPFKKEKAKFYYHPDDLKKIEVRKYKK